MKSYRVIAYRDAFGLAWEQSKIPTHWVADGIEEWLTRDELMQRPGLVPVEVDDQQALIAENERLRRERDEARGQVAALAVEIEPLRLLPRPPTDWHNDVSRFSTPTPKGGRHYG